MAGRVPEPFDATDPAAGQTAAVQATFARLRASFIAGLPARWQEIDAAPDATLRRDALHRLAGAAGSYGLVTLGEAAHRAECLCEGGPSPGLTQALQEALQVVCRLIDDALDADQPAR